VEGLVAPALRERPVAVAAPGADRATILALSDEAKSAGISRGMPVTRAKKLCPDLVLRPPNPRLYARASRALHEILRCYAPIIEPRGYGHAFLDLTGTGRLFGPPVDVARRIQRETAERIGLELAVGAAGNKLVSQIAVRAVRTAGAMGAGEVMQVIQGEEPSFLVPQPVVLLPDLSADIREQLDDYQLELIGEVAAIEERQLCAVFGTPGRILHQHARGIDPSPVLPPEVKAEFRATHTLASDTNDVGVLYPLLRHLTERLGRQLRQRHLVARRITMQLAYSDYETARRTTPIPPAALDIELYDAARRTFTQTRTRTVSLRAVGISVSRFLEAELQLDLWEETTARRTAGEQKGQALQGAIDRIREQWGVKVI
jgi:DNA polymerase IV